MALQVPGRLSGLGACVPQPLEGWALPVWRRDYSVNGLDHEHVRTLWPGGVQVLGLETGSHSEADVEAALGTGTAASPPSDSDLVHC